MTEPTPDKKTESLEEWINESLFIFKHNNAIAPFEEAIRLAAKDIAKATIEAIKPFPITWVNEYDITKEHKGECMGWNKCRWDMEKRSFRWLGEKK